MTAKRGAYQRRGRFALFGSAAMFVAAQLTAGLLLDWNGIAVRFPSAARVLNLAPRGERRPDVVFLGSSRSQDLHAKEATALLRRANPEAGAVEVYNAAVPGGDPIAEDYVLKRLIGQGSRPRLAVVEVSPDTINNYNEGFALHCHRQIVWPDTPRFFIDVWRAGELRKLTVSRLVPLYAHRREIVRLTCATGAAAFLPAVKSPTNSPLNLSVAMEETTPFLPPLSPAEVKSCQDLAEFTHKRFSHYQPGGTTAPALERMLLRCRDHNIEVILVGAPCSTFYRSNFTPEIDAAYTSYMQRLTQTYGCRFIDYRNALPDQYFRDMVHFNPYGGRSFTAQLTREIIVPWLSGRQASYAQR